MLKTLLSYINVFFIFTEDVGQILKKKNNTQTISTSCLCIVLPIGFGGRDSLKFCLKQYLIYVSP